MFQLASGTTILILLAQLCLSQSKRVTSPISSPIKGGIRSISTTDSISALPVRVTKADTLEAIPQTTLRGDTMATVRFLPVTIRSEAKPRPNPRVTRSTRTPNVIFAMADDLGWGDVQYNNGIACTPNLNEMAQSPNTVLLQRYYSGGPVCSPTRGTVLTGRNHNRYCVWKANVGARGKSDFEKAQRIPLPLSEITVAEVMQEAGYSTALFGKWHLGDFKPLKGGNPKWPVSHPGLHGFDQWFATETNAPTSTVNCGCFQNSTCITGHYTNRPTCTNYYTNTSNDIEGWPEAIPGGDSNFIYSLAEKYIKEQVKENKPFFLYLPFHAVHIRYIATKPYQRMYRNYNLKQVDYYGAISELDEAMGRLRKLLKDLGIQNNTLLWFSSDNGATDNTPGKTNGLRGKKGSLYEGGIRVPGMIEWPDIITSNKVSSFPVVSSDLFPTILDILGIKKPSDGRPIDGISILPLLQGKVKRRNQFIYWAYQVRNSNFSRGTYNIAASGDRYKLIATYKNGKVTHYKLYDLIRDRRERKDLSKKRPSLSDRLLQEIKNWRRSVMNSIKSVNCTI